MIVMLLLSVVLVSFLISASVTGYLVRGGAVSTEGYTANLQKVTDGVATVEVITPSGATEVIQVVEGKTAKVGDATISATDLKSGTIFRRGHGVIEITSAPPCRTFNTPN